jgi:hypothetical protein
MVERQGHPEPFLRNVFTLNTCAPIVGCQVLSFKEERELLEVSVVVIKTYINIVKFVIKVRALPQPRQLVIASWRPVFDPRSLHVGFMVARVSLGMVILFSVFSCQ